jgi:hypothetical protein
MDPVDLPELRRLEALRLAVGRERGCVPTVAHILADAEQFADFLAKPPSNLRVIK